MNWIDRPVIATKRERLTATEREYRRQLVLARDRMRKRRMLLRENAMDRPVKLPPVTVLQDWFVDEHGCRARVVGSEPMEPSR